MTDPVIDPDGNSYERRAIEGWLQQNGTSPITRVALAVADLRPNRALQAAIEEYRQSIAASAQPSSVQAELKPSELLIRGGRNEEFLHLSIQPPSDEARSPCDICCVVDTSGSMAVQAEIQTSTNEKFGLSQLDLVKHAMKTIIHSLQPQDRLSIVSFANSATVHFQLAKMTADGKSSALAALERLEVCSRSLSFARMREEQSIASRTTVKPISGTVFDRVSTFSSKVNVLLAVIQRFFFSRTVVRTLNLREDICRPWRN